MLLLCLMLLVSGCCGLWRVALSAGHARRREVLVAHAGAVALFAGVDFCRVCCRVRGAGVVCDRLRRDSLAGCGGVERGEQPAGERHLGGAGCCCPLCFVPCCESNVN